MGLKAEKINKDQRAARKSGPDSDPQYTPGESHYSFMNRGDRTGMKEQAFSIENCPRSWAGQAPLPALSRPGGMATRDKL